MFENGSTIGSGVQLIQVLTDVNNTLGGAFVAEEDSLETTWEESTLNVQKSIGRRTSINSEPLSLSLSRVQQQCQLSLSQLLTCSSVDEVFKLPASRVSSITTFSSFASTTASEPSPSSKTSTTSLSLASHASFQSSLPHILPSLTPPASRHVPSYREHL